MKESAIIRLTPNDIQKLLFEHFKILDGKAQLNISLGNNGRGYTSLFKIEEKTNFNSFVIEEIKMLDIEDVINILNNILKDYDYEICETKYIMVENKAFELDYMEFGLNKKEKVKTKKRGLRKNV